MKEIIVNGGGRSRGFCFDCAVSGGEFAVSGWRVWLKVLRNDLKSYGTAGTGSFCFGEKLEKSTAIQVDLSHLSVVFQCTHRPPRARSTIAIKYSKGRGDQVQFEHLRVGEVQWFAVGMFLPAASALPLRVGGRSLGTVGQADCGTRFFLEVGVFEGAFG